MPYLKLHFGRLFEAIKGFDRNDGMAHAGNMAFLGMLSFFPFMIFLVALSGLFGQTQAGQDAIALILETLPPEVAATIQKPIAGIIKNTSGEILTASIIFALWTAASGVEAARTTVNLAFGKHLQRPLWRRRLESLVIVMLAATLAITGMVLLILGPVTLNLISDFLLVNDLGMMPPEVDEIWRLLRYLISPLALFVALWGMYLALSPARKHMDSLYKAPGALLALVVWLATATGFSTYLKYADNLDITYGGLAGVLVAQIFFFVVSMGFVLGAELNAVYSQETGPESSENSDNGQE